MKKIERTSLQSSQKGVTMIETLIAGGILAIISLGMAGLILVSIAANNRNKIDSTQTMLAEAIVEHVNSTLIGTQQSVLTDCAGNSHTIDTLPGGASLNAAGNAINFSEETQGEARQVGRAQAKLTITWTIAPMFHVRLAALFRPSMTFVGVSSSSERPPAVPPTPIS